MRTYLDDTFAKADLEIKVKASAAGKVRITLSHQEEIVCCQENLLEEDSTFVIKTENPKLWSAEAPNLYDLLLEVMNDNGEVVEVVPQKVGFRRFEMKDNLMTLNGKRIVFKGVNRHEFCSETGRHIKKKM